jgi:hypothetical protein
LILQNNIYKLILFRFAEDSFRTRKSLRISACRFQAANRAVFSGHGNEQKSQEPHSPEEEQRAGKLRQIQYS